MTPLLNLTVRTCIIARLSAHKDGRINYVGRSNSASDRTIRAKTLHSQCRAHNFRQLFQIDAQRPLALLEQGGHRFSPRRKYTPIAGSNRAIDARNSPAQSCQRDQSDDSVAGNAEIGGTLEETMRKRHYTLFAPGLESLNKEPKGWKGRQSRPWKAARSAANSIKLRALVVCTVVVSASGSRWREGAIGFPEARYG